MIYSKFNPDISKAISTFLSPYSKFLYTANFVITLVLTIVLFVPSIRSSTNYFGWNEILMIIAPLLWLFGVIVCLKWLLSKFNITFLQFGKIILVINFITLFAVIAISIFVPDSIICGMEGGCASFDNAVYTFIIFQLPLIGIYLRLYRRPSKANIVSRNLWHKIIDRF